MYRFALETHLQQKEELKWMVLTQMECWWKIGVHEAVHFQFFEGSLLLKYLYFIPSLIPVLKIQIQIIVFLYWDICFMLGFWYCVCICACVWFSCSKSFTYIILVILAVSLQVNILLLPYLEMERTEYKQFSQVHLMNSVTIPNQVI